jgi:hypothetical protein
VRIYGPLQSPETRPIQPTVGPVPQPCGRVVSKGLIILISWPLGFDGSKAANYAPRSLGGRLWGLQPTSGGELRKSGVRCDAPTLWGSDEAATADQLEYGSGMPSHHWQCSELSLSDTICRRHHTVNFIICFQPWLRRAGTPVPVWITPGSTGSDSFHACH